MTPHLPIAGTRFPPLRLDRLTLEILNGLDCAVAIADRSGVVCGCNAAAGRRFPGRSGLCEMLSEVHVPAPFEGWAEALRGVLESGTCRNLTGLLRKEGIDGAGLLIIRLSPLHDPDSHAIIGCVARIDEVPSGEAFEDQHEVSKRLTSLGKLAARVAHELNNPLDGILRYTNLALRLADASEPKLKSYLSESRTGLMRMVQIIAELLEFSKSSDIGFEDRTVDEIVEEAIRTVSARAEEHHVVITVDFQSAHMPRPRGSRIYQVCCNLIKNAIDAMPNGGRLCVTTGMVNGEVVIRVADTGVGLPSDSSRLFEPFFTTKPRGQGTGLGLAICKDFVEELKGTISAAPCEGPAPGVPGRGAVFVVRIPLTSFPHEGAPDP